MSHLGQPSELVETLWNESGRFQFRGLQRERKDAIVDLLKGFEGMDSSRRVSLCSLIDKGFSADLGRALYKLLGVL